MLNLDYKKVAETYGGDVRRIAEAAATGALGPNGPILASAAVDFIRRMRAGELQEKVPQTTVAQQLLGGLPSVPPSLPQPGAPAGLGAISPQSEAPMQEAPMPAPEMPVQQEAPMVMAAGGLTDLPVPDDMFDEPTNGGFDDGYAGGGLVAFARGGETDLEAFRRAIIAQESGGRYGIANRQGSGAMGIGQIMPDTARALAKRLGRPYRPDLLAGTSNEAKEYQDALTRAATEEAWNYGKGDPKLAAAYYFAGPNKKGWGQKTSKYQSDIMRRLGLGDSGVDVAEGSKPTRTTLPSFDDSMKQAEGVFAGLPDSGLGELEAYYRKQLSPEEQKKDREYDMWATLAQIGTAWASPEKPSGSFVGDLGAAIAVALPGAGASRKERKAAEREANRGLAEVLGLKRGERKEVIEFAKDLRAQEIRAQEGETEREFRSTEAEKARNFEASQGELSFQRQKELVDMKDKGFDAVVKSEYDKLKAEADAGVWKTPMGNKPSEAIIRYWANQKAVDTWARRNGSNQNPILPVAPTGNAGVDLSQWGKPTVVSQ